MFEYKVIPAPMQIKRAKGAKTAVERLAIEMEDAINECAADGWEYLRSDTMTVMDKPGRFSRPVEVIETVLIFRRDANTSRPKTTGISFATPKAPEYHQPQMPTPEAPKLENSETVEPTKPTLGGATRD